MAADLVLKAPDKVRDWTDPYIGVNAGYSWGRSKTNVSYFNPVTGLPVAAPAGSITNTTLHLDGFIAGGQIGYNWQRGRWVLGIEADFQWTGEKDTGRFTCSVVGLAIGVPCLGSTFIPPGVTGSSLTLAQKISWFATLRGCLGWTVTPDVLAYVTGGFAWARIKTEARLNGINGGGLPVTAFASDSETNLGLTIGLGLEAFLSDDWTGKIEYLYMDLGDVSGSVASVPAVLGANYRSSITDHVLRIGLNYHF